MSKKETAAHQRQLGISGAEDVANERMLRFPEVVQRTGLSRTTIWRRVRSGEFPAPVQLSGNVVAWHADQLNRWLQTRPRVNYAPRQPGPEAVLP